VRLCSWPSSQFHNAARSIAFYPSIISLHALRFYQHQLYFCIGFVIINSPLPKYAETLVKLHTMWEGFDVGGGRQLGGREGSVHSVSRG